MLWMLRFWYIVVIFSRAHLARLLQNSCDTRVLGFSIIISFSSCLAVAKRNCECIKTATNVSLWCEGWRRERIARSFSHHGEYVQGIGFKPDKWKFNCPDLSKTHGRSIAAMTTMKMTYTKTTLPLTAKVNANVTTIIIFVIYYYVCLLLSTSITTWTEFWLFKQYNNYTSTFTQK